VFVGEKFNLDAQDLRVFEYLIMVFLGPYIVYHVVPCS